MLFKSNWSRKDIKSRKNNEGILFAILFENALIWLCLPFTPVK